MRSILIYFLFFVLTLLVYGCFSSHGRGDEVDSGEDEIPCAPNCPDMDWVTIEGGTFMMGSPEGIGSDDERPQHEVTVRSFKMSKTEVTVAQYGMCVDAGICSVSAGAGNWDRSGRENYPFGDATWFGAREYAQWLGGRLPSESEWEYAARSGGRDIVYPWGSEEVTCERAVIEWDESRDCGNESTAEVCSKPLGNTAQGLCDMVGNVNEWVEDDSHNNYIGAPSDGRAWIDSPRDPYRIIRSSSGFCFPDGCRSAWRTLFYPSSRGGDLGFRVVLDLK